MDTARIDRWPSIYSVAYVVIFLAKVRRGEGLRPMIASFLWCIELNAEASRGLESLDGYTHSTRMTDPWGSLLPTINR
jgi:hypothetical protein